MSQALKIGIICKDHEPEVCADFGTESQPWNLEYFEEPAVLDASMPPRPDFLAVFCPHDRLEERRARLAGVFPVAELIGYVEEPDTEAGGCIQNGKDGLLVQFPMSLPTARTLFTSLSMLQNGRKAHALARSHADDLQALLNYFAEMLESAWNGEDRKAAISMLLENVNRRLHAQESIVYLCGEEGAAIRRAYASGNIRNLELFEQHGNSNIVDEIVRTGEPFLDNRCRYDIESSSQGEPGTVRSILGRPLIHQGEVVGVIEILNKDSGTFTDQDQGLMELLVKPLAAAIGAFRAFDSTERLTITDELTKLYNYRYLKQYLEAEVKRCLRYKKKVSLLFIDLDGFKRVNDTFGHLVGSLALAEIGNLLRKILRETDVIGRYGGDEFVVVLPETPLNGALVIAERVRKRVEDFDFVAQDLSIHLTISLGVANCPKHTLTAEGLIKKADAAMYRAKELNKNTIRVAV